MKIQVIGSGSSGNSYVITSDGKRLIVELGCRFKEILQAMDFNLDKVVGTIVTHSHSDHCAYANQAIDYQIPVYGNSEVQEKYRRVNLITTKYRYDIGGFKVQCLEVPHNALCYSFIIDCPSGERIMFATDLNRFKYRVKKPDIIMLEANYSEDIVVDKMVEGVDIRSQSQNHLEIKDSMIALENNICKETQLVVLLHLSNGFSNEVLFKQLADEVVRNNGCTARIEVATAGDVYEVNESDF